MSHETTPRAAADVTHPGGMRARRAFPTHEQPHLDPFVVFERFYIERSQGFDTHPHSGFEIVSYMLDGGMVHEDSMGHSSVTRAGDAMRITTGSGMSHSEMPADENTCSGLQLWVNLPREQKRVEPSYQDARGAELPVDERDDATITTVVGDGSPLDLHTQVEYYDVDIDSSWQWEVPDDWNGFLYVVSGAGTIDDHPIDAAEFLVVRDGGSLRVTTDEGVRVVTVAGVPHGEPIRQRGPFVE